MFVSLQNALADGCRHSLDENRVFGRVVVVHLHVHFLLFGDCWRALSDAVLWISVWHETTKEA